MSGDTWSSRWPTCVVQDTRPRTFPSIRCVCRRRSVTSMPQLLAAITVLYSSLAFGCFGIGIPQDVTIVRGFAPIGRWAGHWGVDIATREGSPVQAIGDGVVRFAGTVVHNRTVSIDHGGGLVTSYSYLGEVALRKGDRVVRGTIVGESGIHNQEEVFHLSFRVDGRYIDPMKIGRCRNGPSAGLYLAAEPSTYAIGRARDSRRNIRPATQRSHRHGQSRLRPNGARRRAPHASR